MPRHRRKKVRSCGSGPQDGHAFQLRDAHMLVRRGMNQCVARTTESDRGPYVEDLVQSQLIMENDAKEGAVHS
jgi:hypothetical protein